MSTNGSDQDPWAKPGQGQQPNNNSSPNDNNANGNSNNNSNKPNNGSQSNWGSNNSNNNQSPPDIEEIFGNLLKKLGGKKSNNTNKGNSSVTPSGLGKLVPIAVLVGAIIWGASGFYTIKEAERGVVLRFGKLHSIVEPGLNWKPSLIDKVIPVDVKKLQQFNTQGSMLTQDENMVKVEMTVQYQVQDPAKYLFSVTNADNSLAQATDSAFRYVIGHMTMNDILTTGRTAVKEKTWKALNEIIKPYDMGLEIKDVNFQSAHSPEEVKDAFDDAIKAQEDEQRYIREAEAYAREKEPIARGEARKILEEATAYKERVVLDAKGEVERLTRLLPEFKAAPDLLRERLYIETMEKVMAKTPKLMLDGNGNNLNVLPLEQLLNKKANMPSNDNVSSNETTSQATTVAPTSVNTTAVTNSTTSSTATQNKTTAPTTPIRATQGRFN